MNRKSSAARSKRWLAHGAWLMAPVIGAAGATPIDTDIADLGRLRWVVPDGSIGGRDVSIAEISSALVPDALLARIEQRWRESDEAVVLQARSDHWSILSRRTADGFETLQLRATANGGSEGFLTRWSGAHHGAAPPAAARLLPEAAQLTRHLVSRDAAGSPREAETLIARVALTIDAAEQAVDRRMQASGFRAMRAPSQPRDLIWRNDRARFYRGAGAEVLVTLHAESLHTAIVLYYTGAHR